MATLNQRQLRAIRRALTDEKKKDGDGSGRASGGQPKRGKQ